MADFVSFSLLDMREKINFEKLVGKFNSVFIAPSACIGSNYYQHASRTSNNTIPLLMTEMKRTPVNIIQFHPCTVCCSEKSNKISTGQYCRQKLDLIKGENEIRSEFALFLRNLLYCKRSCKCNWSPFHKMKFKYIHEVYW